MTTETCDESGRHGLPSIQLVLEGCCKAFPYRKININHYGYLQYDVNPQARVNKRHSW